MKHSWGIFDWSKLGVRKKINEKKNPQNIHLDKSLDIHTFMSVEYYMYLWIFRLNNHRQKIEKAELHTSALHACNFKGLKLR